MTKQKSNPVDSVGNVLTVGDYILVTIENLFGTIVNFTTFEQSYRSPVVQVAVKGHPEERFYYSSSLKKLTKDQYMLLVLES